MKEGDIHPTVRHVADSTARRRNCAERRVWVGDAVVAGGCREADLLPEPSRIAKAVTRTRYIEQRRHLPDACFNGAFHRQRGIVERLQLMEAAVDHAHVILDDACAQAGEFLFELTPDAGE